MRSLLGAGALVLLTATACSEDGTSAADAAPERAPEIMGIGEDPVPTGAYSIDPDGDPSTPLRVTYEVAAEGWSPWLGAMKNTDYGHLGVTITTVTNVVRDGCHDPAPANPPVGPSVDDLATALADLAPFEVTAAPSDVTMFGYHGKHLELTVPDLTVDVHGSTRRFPECHDGELRSWFAPILGGSFWGYDAEPGLTEAFWILDVDGTRLVLQVNHSPDASSQDLAEMQAIFDSIQIETS